MGHWALEVKSQKSKVKGQRLTVNRRSHYALLGQATPTRTGERKECFLTFDF
ncbi:MAG: hypothetical protein F6J93_20260 [Oscillatoria sp. SIO1A7]|nr:hypothetical protein [Oscillatoria sp. SIO1A7]